MYTHICNIKKCTYTYLKKCIKSSIGTYLNAIQFDTKKSKKFFCIDDPKQAIFFCILC